jgi:uncharacterized iron-regulated membrane protein
MTRSDSSASPAASALYRTIWRWHFYAGLFVIPFILILSVTGSIYLFKPQIERWEERAWQGLPTAGTVSPNVQLNSALEAFPGAQFHSYRLPERVGDAAMIHLAMPDGVTMRDVFVSPHGKVLGSLDPETRIQAIAKRIHGQLLIGKWGSWIVELAASWAIVMIVTGLYLWWPTGGGLAGVVWPRIGRGARVLLRDLHAVTGFWVAGLAMILLLTGLPWADVWGKAFQSVRQEMGWVKGAPAWTIGGRASGAGHDHADHDHSAMLKMQAAGVPLTSLGDVVAKAQAQQLAFPVTILPPGAPQPFGAPSEMVWTVKSLPQNRPLAVTIKYDMATGRQLSRQGFSDQHIVDRFVGYGTAWHEGALFGWVNQLIGLLTAATLITMAVSGFLMWRRRKPIGKLGAGRPPNHKTWSFLVPAIVLLAALLPMLAISLFVLVVFDTLILAHMPTFAVWLGRHRN